MGLFLFLLLLFFVIIPAVRIIVAVYTLRKRARDAYRQAAQAFGANEPEPPRRKGGWSAAPTAKPKKIARDVGEYIAFEEVSTETTVTEASDGNTTQYTVHTEQQIVDAEWEDID